MGKYYLKLEESKLNSLNATFRNGNFIFNIRHELSFDNTDPEKWRINEISDYKKAITKFNGKIAL